jgi:DNA-binding MarR family transcriptional regulator
MRDELSHREVSRLDAIFEALSGVQSAVSLPQVLALIAIARHPGLSVNELAELLDQPQQTVSRHVAILLGRYQTSEDVNAPPFVRQQISASDPRRRALFLSDDGLALLKALSLDLSKKAPSTSEHGKSK